MPADGTRSQIRGQALVRSGRRRASLTENTQGAGQGLPEALGRLGPASATTLRAAGRFSVIGDTPNCLAITRMPGLPRTDSSQATQLAAPRSNLLRGDGRLDLSRNRLAEPHKVHRLGPLSYSSRRSAWHKAVSQSARWSQTGSRLLPMTELTRWPIIALSAITTALVSAAMNPHANRFVRRTRTPKLRP